MKYFLCVFLHCVPDSWFNITCSFVPTIFQELNTMCDYQVQKTGKAGAVRNSTITKEKRREKGCYCPFIWSDIKILDLLMSANHSGKWPRYLVKEDSKVVRKDVYAFSVSYFQSKSQVLISHWVIRCYGF